MLPPAPPDRLTPFVEQMADAWIELDRTCAVVAANAAAAVAVGRSVDALVGESLERLVCAEQRPALASALARLAAGEATSERLRVGVGTAPAWLDLRLTAVRDDAGRPVSVIAVGREGSAEARRADEATRQADRLRLLHAVTAPTHEPADVRIRRALRLTAEMLGVDAGLLSQIEGETFTVRVVHAPGHDVSAGDSLPLAETYCSIAVRTDDGFATAHMGATEHRTHPSYLANGFESYAGVPVHGAEGLVGSLCVFGDAPRAEPFTEADLDLLHVLATWAAATIEHERQLRALAEGDALMRSLHQAVPLLMGVVELVPDATGAPVDVRHRSDNAAAADFFGTTPEAMRDRTATELGAPPETLARWLDAYQRAGASGRPVRFEAVHASPYGDHVLASTVARISPAEPALDQPARFCYVSEDVTEARHAEQALAWSQRRLQALSEATFEGLAFSRDGRVLDTNAQFLELLRLASVDEVVGQEASAFVAPEHIARVVAHMRSGSTEPYEAQVVRPDGARFWAEIQGRAYPAYDADGSVRVTAIRDISRRKAFEAQARFQSDVLAHVSDAVVAVDLDGRITYWNDGAERLHGHAASDVLGSPLDEVVRYAIPGDGVGGEDELPVADPFGALWLAVGASGHLYCEGPRGRRVVSVLASVLADEDGRETGLMAVARDVTAQRRLAERLHHQAHHDALTGLPNRIALRQRVERRLDAGEPFGLLFIDLDHFKAINDTLGHDAGDRFLVAVAERMTAALGDGDTVARLGGDEFAVLVGGPDASATADVVLRALEAPVALGPRRIVPSASIGVVPDARRYASADDLLRDADTAMYDAKRSGRGRASVFGVAMHEAAAARFETELDLRAAIDGGQLRLRFQPIVALDSGTAIGVEALVRWQHPTRGLLAPSEFIPLAEDLGLVAEIDGWVLDATCREIAGWRTDALDLLMVSVNCSDQMMLAEGLAERARRAAEEAGLAPACLTLELTERAFVDSPAALTALADLRRHGLQLSIDDFGTGFSSLGLLHRLPADGLKIDRSFVADLDHSETARAVVRAIVQLADDLKLRVIAEGIETEAQWRRLQDLGCRYGQGYLFARPLEPAQARDVIGRSVAPAGPEGTR